MPDELERLIRDALDERSRHAAAGIPRVDDVIERVTRRRATRRRNVAIVGSLAVTGAGLLGVVALGGDSGGEPVAGVSDASATGTDLVWRCTGEFAREMEDQRVSFFEQCEHVPRPDGAAVPTTLVESVDAAQPTTIAIDPTTTLGPKFPIGVAEGDTLASIALDMETTVEWLVEHNDWRDGADHVLQPGEIVYVPMASGMATVTPPTTTVPFTVPAGTTFPDDNVAEQAYTIVAGDSLASIADRFGIEVDVLIAYNAWPAGREHLVLPGDVIMIPPGAEVIEP